jgi:tetratricopeptide (TPR) repeat protein
MNGEIDQQIEELRGVRTICRRLFWLLLLVLIVSVLAFPISQHSRSTPAASSWSSVDTAMRQQDFPKALAEAQALVAGQPNYYYGHAYLGLIYLATGDVTSAHTHYLRAYELFPNEESEKDLAAIRKRLAAQQPIKLLSR